MRGIFQHQRMVIKQKHPLEIKRNASEQPILKLITN